MKKLKKLFPNHSMLKSQMVETFSLTTKILSIKALQQEPIRSN
jgi:hypothetical protein